MSNRTMSSPLQANAKLTADLAALQKKGASPGSGPATPAPTVPAPSPKTPAISKPKKAAQVVASPQDEGSEEEAGDSSENEEGSEESEQEENEEVAVGETKVSGQPTTEAAKNNRLRRLCEKKPSGRMQVPQEIHDIWAKGGPERLALRDQLEGCGWQKDLPGLWSGFDGSKKKGIPK